MADEELPEAEYVLEDVAEAIVGYRTWGVAEGGNGDYILTGMHGNWVPGINTATCPSNTGDRAHEVPCSIADAREFHNGAGDGCGFYARKYQIIDARPAVYTPDVCGEIYMWGKVYEYEEGYRSEFAAVKRLYVDEAQHEAGAAMIRKLAEDYQAPLGLVKLQSPSRSKLMKSGSVYLPLLAALIWAVVLVFNIKSSAWWPGVFSAVSIIVYVLLAKANFESGKRALGRFVIEDEGAEDEG